MGLVLIFVLGTGNFALHRAVLEHSLVVRRSGLLRNPAMKWVTLGVEFAILLWAMLMQADGAATAAWGYAFYSVINLGSAWVLLSGRVQ